MDVSPPLDPADFVAFQREQALWARRAREATAAGVTAYERLLSLTETGNGGQVRTVARLLAGLFNGEMFPIDPYDLRSLDVAISDDVMACLDALRWGKQDLHTLVPDGERRTLAVLELWKIEGSPE